MHNRLNNIICMKTKINFAFISLMIITSTSACKKLNKTQIIGSDIISNLETKIDSLKIDLNSDGYLDRIYILQANEKSKRKIAR